MTTLSSPEQAADYLKRTALRDFKPAHPKNADTTVDAEAEHVKTPEGDVRAWRMQVPRHDAPVPRLLKYALVLVGMRAGGPGEKVEWWVPFAYKSHRCEVSHEKFGVRLTVWTGLPEAAAEALLFEILKKMTSAVKTVEKLVLSTASSTLARGDATVVNQHHTLRATYDYFREHAINPIVIPDERTEHHYPNGGHGVSFTSGAMQMRFNAFRDLVAAITAYLSLLEHDLVLALAFTNFDPATDNLTEFISQRWAEKYNRVLGARSRAAEHRTKLTDVIERWRNPYSHGGFERGHAATIYLHDRNIGAVPVGLTNIRNSPMFSLVPADNDDIAGVFTLLDDLDSWMAAELPHAAAWIQSGLAVRYDADFRHDAADAARGGTFDRFVERHEYRQEMIDNMDY